jgi:hypothetical protein
MKMKFPPAPKNFVRKVYFLCGLLQFALAFCAVGADSAGNSDDSSLQGELIEPIGKAPTNSAPLRTDKIQDGDFVGFDQLAGFKVTLNNELLFNTNRPAWADAQISAMIPERIRAADGKVVNVEGFMIPLEYNGKKVSKFILAMNQNTCCFGGNPQIHEFIIVSVGGVGVNDEMDIPLSVKGVLRVGVQRKHGKLESVYRLQADKVTDFPD